MQLFQNLIGNAIKYQNAGSSPRIRISGVELERHYQISIADNGIGIEDQYREKIFEIFQRLHSRSNYSGTGVGLAICRKIVERHKGRIWVESNPEGGSIFCFYFGKVASIRQLSL